MSSDKLSRPDESVLKPEQQQLSKARARKSQAIASGRKQVTKASSSSSADTVTTQSIEQLQQAQTEFETFQKALAAQLAAMQQATATTARQAAEIKHSMPLVFEQEFAARDAELRGKGKSGFPVPRFESIAAFTLKATQPRAAADAAIEGADAATSQYRIESAD